MSSATQEQQHLDSLPLSEVLPTIQQIRAVAGDSLEIHRVRQRRHKQYQPIGMVFGMIDPTDGGKLIGWSLCRKDDRYNDTRALHLAMTRACYIEHYLGMPPIADVPHTLRHAIKKVIANLNKRELNWYFPEDEPVMIRREYVAATIEQGYEKYPIDNPKQRRRITLAKCSGRVVTAAIGA